MKLSDLQRKDIININDGSVVGRIIDADVSELDGSLISLIIEKNRYFKSIFSTDNVVNIKYSQIKRIGSDVILIEI